VCESSGAAAVVVAFAVAVAVSVWLCFRSQIGKIQTNLVSTRGRRKLEAPARCRCSVLICKYLKRMTSVRCTARPGQSRPANL